jgi:hypothetical protein
LAAWDLALPLFASASCLRLAAVRICLGRALHTYPRTTIAGVAIPSCVTPSLAYCPPGCHPAPKDWVAACEGRLLAVADQYRNINLSSIDYALRPRLRSRLTLGG